MPRDESFWDVINAVAERILGVEEDDGCGTSYSGMFLMWWQRKPQESQSERYPTSP